MNTTMARARDGLGAPAHFPHVAQVLLALPAQGCRWPMGELGSIEFHFCGQPRAVRGSYCATHRRIACEPARIACEPAR